MKRIIGLALLVLLIGCSDKTTNEEAVIEDNVPINMGKVSFTEASDMQLLQVGRVLGAQYKELLMEADVEKFDELRQELFLDYDFYAPIEDMPSYQDYTTKISNETIVKHEDFFRYEFTLLESYINDKGQKVIKEGFVSMSIFQGEDNVYRIAMIL